MGLFNRKQRGLLPANVVQMMERFGRHEIDPMGSADDGYAVFQATQEPLISASRTDPSAFISALADACLPVGGWAVYGADRTVINLVGTSPGGDDWLRILDASIESSDRTSYLPCGCRRTPGTDSSTRAELGTRGSSSARRPTGAWLASRP